MLACAIHGHKIGATSQVCRSEKWKQTNKQQQKQIDVLICTHCSLQRDQLLLSRTRDFFIPSLWLAMWLTLAYQMLANETQRLGKHYFQIRIRSEVPGVHKLWRCIIQHTTHHVVKLGMAMWDPYRPARLPATKPENERPSRWTIQPPASPPDEHRCMRRNIQTTHITEENGCCFKPLFWDVHLFIAETNAAFHIYYLGSKFGIKST